MEELRVYWDFRSHYLPDLFNYVVAIVFREDGKDKIGSGVLVNVQGRHFVATAEHCLRENVRVMRPHGRLEEKNIAPARSLLVLRQGRHETLDVGYLEIVDPRCLELNWGQLDTTLIVGGLAHVVGYPKVMNLIDWERRELSVCAAAFGSQMIEATDEYLKFVYPVGGFRWDDKAGQWFPSPFPETPEGFSGGGCFGVEQDDRRGFTQIRYNLLGIDYSWSWDGRWVKVEPIKQWCDLLKRHGHYLG
jgi:hypothetical protein